MKKVNSLVLKRNKKINNNILINCPIHGMSKTYDLFKLDNIKGIGCSKCFSNVESMEVKDENYRRN